MKNKELMSAITLYRSQYEAIMKLPDPDFRIITGAILKYAFDGEMPKDLTVLQLAVFDMCKGNVDKSNERRRLKAELNRKYYESKKQEKIQTHSDTLRHIQTGSSYNENENENENVNENENENNIYNNSLSERENFLKKICRWHDEWNDLEGVVEPEGYALYVEANNLPKTKKYFESYCYNVKKLRKKEKEEKKMEVVPEKPLEDDSEEDDGWFDNLEDEGNV